MVGTTLAMTTPLTALKSKPRRAKRFLSSVATSSAVHSRRDVTRQSAARRSPSNRARVTLVLPTSTARSTARTLAREVGRFAPKRLRPGDDVELALRDRRGGIPGRDELAVSHQLADLLMGLAEGPSSRDQLLGRVGRQEHRVRGRFGEALSIEHEVAGENGRGLERLERVLHRREQRHLVLLEVSVVGEREGLDDGCQADEGPERASGPAAKQLRDVRVLLLRHQARSSRNLVGQRDESELRAGPQDDVFA